MQRADSLDFFNFLANYTLGLGLQIGLKNTLSILPDVAHLISFAVNEECARSTGTDGNTCSSYKSLISAGKPVFHIEYPKQDSTPPRFPAPDRGLLCNNLPGFSTVLKALALDCWVMFCDGSTANTDCSPQTSHRTRPPPTKTSSTVVSSSTSMSITSVTSSSSESATTIISTTSEPETTSVPETTTSKSSSRLTTTSKPRTSTSSSVKPTSSSGNGSGCKQKHYDQCGGNDWKGCTVCAVSFLGQWCGGKITLSMKCQKVARQT
jgi:hypothetical protein